MSKILVEDILLTKAIFYVVLLAIFYSNALFASLGQYSNDLFMPNPAEMSIVKYLQIQAGAIYDDQRWGFVGVSPQGAGAVNASDPAVLPYTQVAKRITDKLVAAINVNPTYYGSVKWPNHSIIDSSSVRTTLLGYTLSPQMSYQLTNKFTIGLGINIINLRMKYLDRDVQSQLLHNDAEDTFVTGDIGMTYAVNPKNIIGLSYYSDHSYRPYGMKGSSSYGNIYIGNTTLSSVYPGVATLSFLHIFNDYWLFKSRLWMTHWTISNQILFANTALGNDLVKLNWGNTWSIDGLLVHVFSEKISGLVQFIYSTNPIPSSTFSVAFPSGPPGTGTGLMILGAEIQWTKQLSTQILLGHLTFLPTNIPVNNSVDIGKISAGGNTILVGFKYAI